MSRDDNDDYASKGVAGTGLGLGIAGTALALLAGANNNGGGGFLGLFGGGGNNWQMQYALENERRLGRMEAVQAATATAVEKDARFDNARFDWMRRETDYEIEAKTCRFIPGKLFLSPNEMADPYEGGRNVIVSRHYNGEGRCGYSPCGGYNAGYGCGWF
ncbi:hypothetical protein [uncultured Desulfovibrio sp.]|uniref:hypothetical protein n=1 Tax=uncultured Desulfovibrio sp. TaxID=167968 RepID=UPI002049D1A0|nr:hypothetical protein [uncultured Desulfovibrio sp.]DAX01806.1 MAG TPA: hypothetical protein [Bacteriophage sp.]